MARPIIDFTKSLIVSSSDLDHLSDRALPTAPDGRYDEQARATGESGTSNLHSALYNIVSKTQSAILRGPVIKPDDVPGIVDALENKEAIDDRKGFFVNLLASITKLPPGDLQNKLNDEAMAVLYKTLTHPPATYIGKQFAFRSADGSGNNPEFPLLGKSGLPYARSVQGKHPLPDNILPDPGLVFDTILKARDFQPHPGRNSSLTFAFASLVTHSLFRTDPIDVGKNNTTSYLDLSPLYGYDQRTQDEVRDKEKGRGLLYPDTFSEERLFFVPPAASALLVIFSRNHNYIANMLLKINERKRWSAPPPSDPERKAAQDEEIFQTARLVNCGHFMAMIFGDYVAGFLGLGRDGSTWSMNPFDPITTRDGQIIGRAQGNHVSAEFNVLYRWHATTAEEDIKWTEDLFGDIFGGKTLETLTLDDFKTAARTAFRGVEPDPKKRNFGGMRRQADGSFADDDIAKILQDATDKVAGAYRARGTPSALRVIEILGIEQARAWGVCTMNEFRAFLGLKQFDTFEEWCSDKSVAQQAARLYGHIDNLELYVGLQAEDCMPLGPGSGICCGYTMTRAILGDAIALVRGDRYYTQDYTPWNLTSWGYQDCVRDPDNGAFGAALPRLLMRHLPRHYPANSVYSLFPFFTPEVTKKNLTKLNRVNDGYDFTRPVASPVPKVLNTLTGIRYVFANNKKYHVTYKQDMEALTQGYGFMLTFDDDLRHNADRKMVWHALFPDKKVYDETVEWYKKTTAQLLAEKSFEYEGVPGRCVDIIIDVVNLVSVHWAADKLCGIPLKTTKNPRGIFTEQEMYGFLQVLFMCVFENVQPEHGWKLRSGAKQVSDILNGLIERSISEVSPLSASDRIKGAIASIAEKVGDVLGEPRKESHDFHHRLASSGRDMRVLVACVIGLAVGSSVNYAQAAAQVIDFYLSEDRKVEREALISVCHRDDDEAKELLRGYIREGMRLNPQYSGLFRTVEQDDIIPQGDGKEPLQVHKGDLIFASFKNAHLNPVDFPEPNVVNPRRPAKAYELQGAGFHGCPGVDFVAATIPEIIKIVFKLPNLRRAPGSAGICKSFNLKSNETDTRMYVDITGNVTPWPGSLQLMYDV